MSIHISSPQMTRIVMNVYLNPRPLPQLAFQSSDRFERNLPVTRGLQMDGQRSTVRSKAMLRND